MTEYISPKPSSKNTTFRENNKKEAFERRRCILYMIASYLYDINLGTVATFLEKEAQLDNQYQVCDNVDLDIILQEYQSYYHTKFQRHPKILRKLSESERSIRRAQGRASSTRSKPRKSDEKDSNQSSNESDTKFDFEIVSIGPNATPKVDNSLITYGEIDSVVSISDFAGYPSEWREIVELIMKDFIPNNLGVSFEDCIGLESTTEILKEATVYPMLYPKIFKNVPIWKGILLFGPPGTGKTLLAKALACESPSKFINITSSTFISKWRGESEKMIKVLFDIARHYAPTTIFIDEIDAIVSSNDDYNHEASKRFKSELLVQMDGILRSEVPVFVLATTNYPWKLDLALLRRFEKRIFVPMPNEEARTKILHYYLNNNTCRPIEKDNLEHLAIITKNYSGSDLKTICQEASMIVIREKIKEIKDSHSNKNDEKVRPVMLKDIKEAIIRVKPCTDISLCQKHVEWNVKYGSQV